MPPEDSNLKSIDQVLRELEPTVDPDDLTRVPNTPLGRAGFWKKCKMQMVYFIQGDPKMPVKIGTAIDPEVRMREGLQSGNHMKLTILEVIPGWFTTETRLHREYKDWRLNGEWFRWSGLEEVFPVIQKYAYDAVDQYQREGNLLPLPTAIARPLKRRKSKGTNWTQVNRVGRHRRRSYLASRL